MSLGIDIACTDDLDPFFTLVTERTSLIQAIYRRFITETGTLTEDEDYGLDLREWLGESITDAELARLEGLVEEQCLAEERVLRADATVTYDQRAERLSVTVRITADELGQFELVLGVTDVSVEILQAA